MLRLLYISTARAAFTQAQLGELLRVSRRNNEAAGVSGLLIVRTRRFLQALEGPANAVEATYARILADSRHFATVVLSKAEVNERLFPTWAMGYQPLTGLGTVPSVAANVAALIDQIDDPTVRAYFMGFAEQQAV